MQDFCCSLAFCLDGNGMLAALNLSGCVNWQSRLPENVMTLRPTLPMRIMFLFLIFRMLPKLAPQSLCELWQPHAPGRAMLSTHQMLLDFPRCRQKNPRWQSLCLKLTSTCLLLIQHQLDVCLLLTYAPIYCAFIASFFKNYFIHIYYFILSFRPARHFGQLRYLWTCRTRMADCRFVCLAF